MTFKVGDRVVFGVDRSYYPLWNITTFKASEKLPILIEAEVRQTMPDGRYVTKHKVGLENMFWTWPALQPTTSGTGVIIDVAEALRLWWPRLADAKVAAAAPSDPPVWTETVSLGRRNDLPDPILAQMVDRGERGVRRTLRFWPENRRLVHRQERIKGDIEDTFRIQWFWETIEAE